ncbi:MAG: hypothetical protein DHS20C17_17280 [Cyclobacteriaceae bacterium]|nr:MAG: hypothetical protein DHS20C17_17280 [Cyclobacteriaceae bacterium]
MQSRNEFSLVLPPTPADFWYIAWIFLGLQFLTLSGKAQEQQDSLTFQHKDSLIFHKQQMLLGELLSIGQGRISFDSDDAGVISVKNYKIRTLSANIHSYRIRTSQLQLIYGKLRKSTKDGMVIIDQGITVTEVPIRSIIDLERYDRTFKQRISGKVGLGYNFTKSSNIGRLNVDLSIRYLAQVFQSTITANSIMTQDQGSFSRDTENLTITNQLNLSYRWIGVGLLSYQRNLELGILRRFQEALLLGYNFISYSNRQLYAAVGVAINQELTDDNTSAVNLVEVPIIANYTFYQFQKPNIQFVLTEKVYFGVTQTGRVRNDANLTIDWEIISDFTLGVNLYSSYDNQASETTTSNFDFGVVVNVGYKF